jgi:ubiquinone/menaquinone biosynthesis C-methylase UbiE
MNEKFDKKYFDDIWGTIHRHDYCESLAESLISKYGKVRFLDIGTGCGELVRLLREKGCVAYGLEISEYAVANSHGNVVLGSVTDIPFKDNSFDVVFSQGLWEYVPEEDIAKAWKECNRVGKIQEHNIDCLGSGLAEETFVTSKPREWWDEKLQLPKILVTCPVYDGKEYCFQKWIDNVKSLTYPNYDIFVVDNSSTEDFYNKYKDQIPMVHKTFRPDEKNDAMYRVCQSMGVVREHFLKGNYTHWMNIEADNIPPKDVIETLLAYSNGEADWVSHCYPATPTTTLMQGIGCTLFSRRLMEDFDWSNPQIADDSPDAEIWNWVKDRPNYKTVELWFVMKVLHLK